MRVYIAAPYPEIEAARALMARVEAVGIEVTSRWLKFGFEELTAENAEKDLEDVRAADALIAFNPPGYENKGTGGRHVEFGYAVALLKPIILLGAVSHIFHLLPGVVPVDNHTQLLYVLRGMAVEV